LAIAVEVVATVPALCEETVDVERTSPEFDWLLLAVIDGTFSSQ
jgi:hypothetical protein